MANLHVAILYANTYRTSSSADTDRGKRQLHHLRKTDASPANLCDSMRVGGDTSDG
ncbi:MAG: hypothetical protein OJF49_002494 [Ktedonobacterales bacterium]|nr:MAG: hypothetical protein OJF49_002494 [Ktedonobacterales bacterium]